MSQVKGFIIPSHLPLVSIGGHPLKLEVIFCVQAVISPLLSNLYVNEVDQMLERAKAVTRRERWNLVILVDSQPRQQWLRQAVEKRLREELAKLQVEVNEEKSRTVDLQRGDSFGFLGFEFRRIRSPRGRWMPLLLPKGKKRTALVGKLKEIFRASRSQTVEGVIEKINPILRSWVAYFAIGHSTRCFSYPPILGRDEDSETLGPGISPSGLRLETMEQGMAVRNPGTLLGVPSFVSASELGSRSSPIGVQERVVREIRTLRAMWRGLETGSRFG